MKSGIYIITNLINNKYYIGRSKDIKYRLRKHKERLIAKTHENDHLQNAVNLYGIENFSFEDLEYQEIELLPSLEHYWCNLLQAHNRNYGYNIEPTDPNGNPKLAEETKKKISNKQKGRKHTQEHKNNVKLGLIGKRAKENPLNRKPIIQLDKQNNFIKEWSSIRLASKSLDIWESNISAVLHKNIQKTAGGFKWEFKIKLEDAEYI